MLTMRRQVAAGMAAVLLVSAHARADVVLDWNDLASRTFVTQGQNPFAQARFGAIVQLAVFEAVNAVTGDYEPYLGIVAPLNTSAEAAAVAAAYRVLKTYFPAAPLIDDARAASLAAIPDGVAKTNGIDTGERAAAAMIANRVGDNSSPVTTSPVGLPIPGVWQLTLPPGCAATATGGAFYNWRDITPFGVPDVGAFVSGPPPDPTSSKFRKDYTEIKTVGAAGSTARPADRSDVARFYAATSPTYAFSQAARQMATAQQGTLSENARALALMHMAANDALVTSFATKYTYNYWRPETAIRFTTPYGAKKQVEPDPTFVPFITAPCFPSYPSNHASGSTGAAEILRRIYGQGGHTITLTNLLVPAIASLALDYRALNEITRDVDDARIYGGIHYRFDQEAGVVIGRQVATYVFMHNLRPIGR